MTSTTDTYEDPKQQLFYNSLNLQFTIATDTTVPAADRVKALSDLQDALLAEAYMADHKDLNGKLERTVNRALNQVKRLHTDTTNDPGEA